MDFLRHRCILLPPSLPLEAVLAQARYQGFIFVQDLFLIPDNTPDTDLREVYSGILDWRACWLEKENLARRRESESTPAERSLRQQEPPSRVSQINSTNPFVFCLQQHPFFRPARLSSCKTVVKRRAGAFLGRLSKGQTVYLLYYG